MNMIDRDEITAIRMALQQIEERMPTKRELFAALAMMGILAKGDRTAMAYAAGDAVRAANLLLAELEKPTEGQQES